MVIAGTGLNDIWVIDVRRGMTTRVTSGPAGASNFVWSPDGKELIYNRKSEARMAFHRQELRAGAVPSELREAAGRGWPEEWSQDGKVLLYRRAGEENGVWALPLEGKGEPELVLKTEFPVARARVSPDGRWVAYMSRESGGLEVYVEPLPRRGERVRVSRDGGEQPRWRGDGKELFYLSHKGRLMAVPFGDGTRGAEVGVPEELIAADTLRAVMGDPFGDYDVTPDGERFLIKRRLDREEKQRIHLLTNWTSLLDRQPQ
ncbi:MAG: hypothetical protein ABR517_08330 [Thermoanaerobaculia bacterium]